MSKKTLHHAVHHAFIAAIIASFIFLAEQQKLLGWLDVISIRISQAIITDNHLSNDVEVQKDVPVVLHIGNEMFENVFSQKSPLDRAKFTSLIKEIIKQEPAALAIDFDLSPGADEMFSASQARSDLDSVLKDAAISCLQGARCVTLVTPHIVQSKDIRDNQYHWMKSRCHDGVKFAYPTLITHQTVAISYPSDFPNLGNVTFQNNKEVLASHHPSIGLCDYIESHTSEQFHNHQKLVTSVMNIKSRQLNTDFFHHLKTENSEVSFRLDSNNDVSGGGLKGKVVFLGGSYGKDDTFLTTMGAFSGVFLHAAGYYSSIYSVGNVTHALAFIVDVFFGMLLGFSFAWGWAWYRRTKDSYLKAPSIFGYLIMRSLLVFNLLLLLAILAVIFASSGYLLEHQLWLNPGPLVIGMFVHSLLSNGHTEHSHKNTLVWFRHMEVIIKGHPDLVWQIPLVFYVVLSFFNH